MLRRGVGGHRYCKTTVFPFYSLLNRNIRVAHRAKADRLDEQMVVKGILGTAIFPVVVVFVNVSWSRQSKLQLSAEIVDLEDQDAFPASSDQVSIGNFKAAVNLADRGVVAPRSV